MWRAFWIFGACFGLLAAMLVYAGNTATFLFRHPDAPNVRIVIDRETGSPVIAEVAQKIEAARLAAQLHPPQPSAQPKVQADELKYDFGIMDPLTEGSHKYVLRNGGQAPLKLTVGPTTCKCTVGGLDKREVAPGDQAIVTLEWNTGTSILYSHAATIYTNDPDRKSLEVRVSGKVRVRLGADVSEVVMPDVRPTASAVAECFLYSQVWEDFEVQSVESRLAGLTWEMAQVDPERAPELGAKTVERLRIAIPAAGLSKRFSDTLRIRAKVAGSAEIQSLDLPLLGNVLGPLAVYGGDIDEDGTVELGSIPWGRGKKTKLLIKVRDSELDLGDVQVEVTPSFLQARLTPREGSTPGLYDLHLELPAETAVCQYLGKPQGELTIKTGHPRIGTLKFPVRFAVLAQQD